MRCGEEASWCAGWGRWAALLWTTPSLFRRVQSLAALSEFR